MTAKQNRSRYEKWKQKHIANADYFVTCLFLGLGTYDRRESNSLVKAREIRRTMEEDYKDINYGRHAMIYVVTKDENLTIFVE